MIMLFSSMILTASIHPHYAILPLLLLAGAILFVTIVIKWWGEVEKDDILVAILGLKGAGKTTLWNKLRGIDNINPEATSNEEIAKFTITEGEKNYNIIEGRDIGGGDDYVTKYDDIIQDRVNIIYFIVDIHRLEEQKKEIKVRLRKIINILNNKNMSPEIVLLATHKDTFNKAKDTSLFIERMLELQYMRYLNNHKFSYRAVNLLDNDEIKRIKQEIIENRPKK